MNIVVLNTRDRAQLLAIIEQLRAEHEQLSTRLDEAEQTLAAIRSGDVDAIVVAGPEGEQVFSLSGAETVYRQVFETMAEAALNVDPIGRILFCNAAFTKLVEAPMAQLLGHDLADWVQPGERDAFQALLRQCERQPVRQRVVFRAVSGLLKAVYLTGHRLDQSTGPSLCLVATDLTELENSARHIELLREQRSALEAQQAELREARQRAEQAAAALLESEERLRFALEATHIGAWDLDLVDRTARRSLEYDRIFGYGQPLPRWTYAMFLAHVLPEDRAVVDAKFNEPLATRGDWNFECRIRRADSQIRWIWVAGRLREDAAGHPQRMIGIVQDITERKRAEETLSAKQQLLDAVVKAVPDAINVMRGRNLCIELINPAYQNLCPGREFVGHTMDEAWPELDGDFTSLCRRVLETGEPYMEVDGHFRLSRSPDGPLEDRYFTWGLYPVDLVKDDGRLVLNVASETTARKRAEEWQRLTAQVFDTTLESIVVTDADRNIIKVNEAFCRITGYSRGEVLGRNPRMLQSGRHDPAFYAAMWREICDTGHWTGELWNRRKDGGIYPELMTISAIANDGGAVTHYVSISSDITPLKEHEKRLEHIANYDALTGIPNRMLLMDRMRQALAWTRREKNLLAVCYLDLDGFKPINDTLGHDAGDSVLIEVARRIGLTLRGGDTVARLGGDEFVVLMLGIDSPAECHAGLDRLLQIIGQSILIQDHSCAVTASVGATLYPPDEGDPDTLLRHADQAMYLAKQSGKNRYHIFDPRHDERIRVNRERKERIERGFQDREFELFYQPKVALRSRQVAGVEALIRWRHPERGVLLPSEFLPTIENSELEIRLGEWVIDAALAQMEQWHAEGLDLDVSVNIAAAHLQSEGFVDILRRRLAGHPGLRPDQFQIEILETAALEDLPTANGVIEDCAALGVGLALDDFGTGYSSLSYLRMIPADTLKIDQSFVRDMLVDKGDYSIVQGVIAMAHAFGRSTIAEGVETPGHFRALEEMGCNIGQGYGIARPMPAKEAARWCRAFASGLSMPSEMGGMH